MNKLTQQYQRQDAAHHIHPFTDSARLHRVGARVITRADGIWLWDSEGNKILDAMAGLWCVNIGYGRVELAEVAREQLSELPYYNLFFQCAHPRAIELAAALDEITPPHMHHVFFTCSGSEANDTNVRFVRHYWASLDRPQKNVIISRRNAYHGSTVASASLGGMRSMHAQGGLPIPDIVHIDQPYWYGEGGELSPDEFGLAAASALEQKILELGEDRVAAFIAEPIQGAGGMIVPPSTYWPAVKKILARYDILLIADEVITGCGRTGRWFASEHYDLQPDLMTIAKGLSSGYAPIGATVLSDRVADVLIHQGGELTHGYTYSGHPLCTAIALANLRIMRQERVVEQVADVTAPYLQQRWQELNEYDLVGETRCFGMLAAFELSADKSKRLAFDDACKAGELCRDLAIEQNLVMRSIGQTMVISPPLVIEKHEIDILMDRVHSVLRAFTQAMAA